MLGEIRSLFPHFLHPNEEFVVERNGTCLFIRLRRNLSIACDPNSIIRRNGKHSAEKRVIRMLCEKVHCFALVVYTATNTCYGVSSHLPDHVEDVIILYAKLR